MKSLCRKKKTGQNTKCSNLLLLGIFFSRWIFNRFCLSLLTEKYSYENKEKTHSNTVKHSSISVLDYIKFWKIVIFSLNYLINKYYNFNFYNINILSKNIIVYLLIIIKFSNKSNFAINDSF